MSVAVAGLLFVVGAVVTFMGARVRGRILGVSLLGAGALVALAGASPGPGAPWGVMVIAIPTLSAMIAFAALLARRLEREQDAPTSLDEDRP